ncbi:MAG: hypothetical protein HQK51_07190 [Oligoflexia bacterium]|nr:hypothetical protein [Oligoflexia bacterium]
MSIKIFFEIILKIIFPFLFFLLLTILICGCSSNSDKSEVLPSLVVKNTKSESSIQACNKIHIPRDIALNGDFVYNFLLCSSNKTIGAINENASAIVSANFSGSGSSNKSDLTTEDNYRETLQGIVNTTNALGTTGIQTLIDFTLRTSSTSLNKNEYSTLRTMMILLERGGNGNEAGIDQSALQELLTKFDPHWLMSLILKMNETNDLNILLDHTTNLLNKVDSKSFIALVRLYLEREDLGRALVDSSSPFLENKSLYESTKELMTLEKTYTVSKIELENNYANWANPRIRGNDNYDYFSTAFFATDATNTANITTNSIIIEDEVEIPYLPVKTNTFNALGVELPKVLTGKERYANFLESIGVEGLSNIEIFINDLTESFFKNSSSERLSIIRRAGVGIRDALNEQKWPLKKLFSLLNTLKSTKTSDLNEVSKGIEACLTQTDGRAIAPFNLKIGSSKLHSKMEELIYEGGRFDACNGMILNGLKDIKEFNSNFTEWLGTYNAFFAPNDNCKNKLSPLAASILEYLDEELGCTDELRNKTDDKRFCPRDDELKVLSQKLTTDFNDTFDYKNKNNNKNESDKNVVAELIISSLNEYKEELRKDKFALQWKHWARGVVLEQDIDKILLLIKQKQIQNNLLISAEDIAVIDSEIESDSYLSPIFIPNFLESVLTEKIQNLAAVAEQFNGLFNIGSDQKLMQILMGIYKAGPFEQIMSEEFYFDKLLKEFKESNQIPKDTFRVKEILARLRVKGAIFKDNRLDRSDNTINYKFLGEKNSSIQLDKNGDFNIKKISMLNLQDVFNSENSPETKGTLRFYSLLKYGDFLGKDVFDLMPTSSNTFSNNVSESDAFISWVQAKLYPHLDNYEFWNQRIPRTKKDATTNSIENYKNIDLRFFDNDTKYSAEELRKLFLFVSTNFLVAPKILPDNVNSYERNKTATNQMLSFPLKNGNKWSTFLNFYPKKLPLFDNDNELIIAAENTYRGIFANKYFVLSSNLANNVYNIENGCEYYLTSQEPTTLDQLPALALINSKLITYAKINNKIDKQEMNLSIQEISSLNKLEFIENKKTYLTPKQCDDIALNGGHKQNLSPEIYEKYTEIIKTLSTLNLLTSNNTNPRMLAGYMPFIGMSMGKNCWDKDYKPALCAINFKDFNELKKYVMKLTLTYFCPYIFNSNFEGSSEGFSNSFINLVSKNLEVSSADSNDLIDCQNADYNQVSSEAVATKLKLFPKWIQEHVLTDLINMGPKPTIKSDLINLISEIRFHKLKNFHRGDHKLFSVAWMNSPGVGTLKSVAYTGKELSDHKGLFTYPAGQLNTYVSLIKKEASFPTEGGSIEIFENALKELGTRSGELSVFIKNILIDTLEKSAEKGETTLEYFLSVFYKMKDNPKYIDATVNLFSYIEDMETLPIMNKSIPEIVQHIRDEREKEGEKKKNPFRWSDPGLRIFKELFRQENLHAINDFLKGFYPQEMFDFVSLVLNTLSKAFPLTEDASKIIRIILNTMEESLVAKHTILNKDNNNDNLIIDDYERSLKTIFNFNYPKFYSDNVNAILDSLSFESAITFEGKTAPSLISQNKEILDFTLNNSHKLLELYQNFFSKTVSNASIALEENYFQKLLLSFVRPLKTGEIGKKSLVLLLEDSKVASFDQICKPLITDLKERETLIGVLKVLNLPKIEDYKLFAEEIHQILPNVHNIINYILRRGVWREETPKEFIHSLEVLQRLSSEGNVLWDQQINVARSWFPMTNAALTVPVN